MNNLPKTLHVDNKKNFSSINDMRLLMMVNEEIFNLLISRDSENEYYDLDSFSNRYLNRNIEKMHIIMEGVQAQLIKLGWKCKYSFNDTGLFIYSTETPPPSCW